MIMGNCVPSFIWTDDSELMVVGARFDVFERCRQVMETDKALSVNAS